MSKPRIAFIGLGAMGLHMAHILKGAGYDVRGYDVRPEVVQSFHQDDVSRCCKSVSKAAVDADIIILMVVSHHQARSILFAAADGDGDALVNLARGADILLMATCSQEAVISLADDVAKKRPDVGFVDAPVSGGVEGAKSGGLTIMAAAKEDVFHRVEPVLRIMGSKLYHVGTEVGQGSAMKAVNQVSTSLDPSKAVQLIRTPSLKGALWNSPRRCSGSPVPGEQSRH
jgi:putative dehydrogenase